MSDLPIVVVPVGVDDDALDACLAALDACTPPGARVWLADDAQSGPRGYAIVGIFIIAAVITPPDVVSQLMLAIPMCVLYELGIIAAKWVASERARPADDAHGS